jgi:hypothetical protein
VHLAIALAAAALLQGGCSKNSVTGPDQIVGSGRIVSEQRVMPSFSGIQVTGTARVVVRQDTLESLRVEADDNIMGRLTTSVRDGVLLVGLEQGSYSNVTINVYAAMRTLSRLESVGAAEFSSAGPISTDAIVCSISGAGKITLTGSAARQTVQVSGAGDVHNSGLTSSLCSVLISGTGTVEVNVTRQLDAVVSGAGSVLYAGNPPVVNQTVSGFGSVRQL